jgi:hypothetical protein
MGASSYRPWICAHLGVNLLLVLLNLWVAVPRPVLLDAMGYYAWAQSILADGDVDLGNQLAGNPFHPLVEIDGRSVHNNKYSIGWTLVALPFMAAGQAAVVAVNALSGASLPLDGLAPIVVRAAWLGVGLFGTLGLFAAHETVRRIVDAPVAFWSVLLAWAGTSAVAYTWKVPSMSHVVSLGAVAICYWMAVLCAERPSRKYRFLMGLAGGLAVATRIVNLPLLLPALMLAGRTGGWRSVVPGLAGFAIPVGLQIAVWKLAYGVFYFDGYAVGGFGFSPSAYNTLKVLFSSRHGLFFWHPVTVLSVAGLALTVIAGKPRRSVAAGVLAALVLQVAVYGSWSLWSLGWSHGARWTTDCLVLWAMGIAWFLDDARSRRWRGVAYVACAACVAVTVLLILGQFLNRVPPDEPLRIGAYELF